MQHCPNCKSRLPFKKFFMLNNFSEVICPYCRARLRPDRKMLTLIGGISGASAALTVGLANAAYYLLGKEFGLEIIIGASVSVILIYLASVFMTRNMVDFKNIS